MNKKVFALILVSLMVTCLPISGFSEEELRVGVMPLVEHIPVVMAQKEMSAIAKIKVRPDIYTSWTGLEAAFRTGAIEVAAVTLPKALLMAYDAVPLKILMVINRNGNALVIKGGDTSQALKGKIFGGSGSDTMDLVVFSEFLKNKSLKLGAEVRSLLIPLSKATTLLKEDRIAGYCLPEPYGAIAERESQGAKVIFSKDILPKHINSVLIVNANTLKNNPEVIKKLVKYIKQACEAIEKDKANSKGKQTAMAQIDSLKIKPADVERALSMPKDRVVFENLNPSLKEVEDVMQSMMSLGLLGGKVNLKETVDTKYIE